MKRRLWLIILLFGIFNIDASQWKQAPVEVTHENSGTQVYVTDYTGKKIKAFSMNYMPSDPTDFSYQQQRDVLTIMSAFQDNDTGTVYVDLPQGKVSPIFRGNFLEYYVKKIVMLYNPNQKTFTFIPMFEVCKNPLVIHLDANKYGANLGSTFLPNGNVYIKYIDSSGKDHTKTIELDYTKLFANCKQ